MLNQTAEHALRAVLFLARQPGGGPVPAESIAGALGAPRNYLGKTLQALAREGIVEGIRGPTGGFRLAVAATDLTLGRVVEPFGDGRISGMCLLGGIPCNVAEACAAHARWTALVEEARAGLGRTTVAELLASPAGSRERRGLDGSSRDVTVAERAAG